MTKVEQSSLAATTLTQVKQPTQEDLLGYVLGALDADQQHAVQKLIDEDPQLEEQMLDIKSSLIPLEMLDEASGTRPGLARRTCEMVSSLRNDLVEEEAQYREPLLSGSSWPARDFLVAAASIAILASILIPVLDQSKYQSQIIGCRNNLVSIGRSLASYDDAHGHLPMITPGSATAFMGYTVPILLDEKFMENDNLLFCPMVRRSERIRIPSCEEIKQCSVGPDYNRIRNSASGDYAFSFGYVDAKHKYQAPNIHQNPHRTLIADKPSVTLIGGPSDNHRGNGQNVLFQDLSSRFVKGNSIAGDWIYTNDYNMVGPGAGAHDSVIGPSHLSPFGVSEFEIQQTPAVLVE